MSVLIDHDARRRFVEEQGKNISVIAPAGVGKTRSIVERIVHLAKLKPEKEAADRLSRLVVVTYSVKAAQEMQQRTRTAMRAAAISPQVQRAFQQTFFGTIHSYCVRLLDRFGHYLGLPSPVGLLQADDELWNRFLLRGLGHGISRQPHLQDLFHFYAPQKLYALGKEISPGLVVEIGPIPTPDVTRALAYQGTGLHHATRKTIGQAQAALKVWSESWVKGERFRPLPKCPESEKAADFAEIWNEAFAPLHDWLRTAALAFGRHVANDYEAFRLSEAVMTYDDQIRLALRVLERPAVQAELKSERLSILLDEAQDTDPRQFEVLRRVAGLGENPDQTDDQSFSIVGDFQQAIYAPRSDLTIYRKVHDEISIEPRGATSQLKVTFRCDRAIINFVNRIFPSVLNNANGQCAFVELVPRDAAGPGQVARWVCPDEPGHAAGEKCTADVLARHEATFIAQRIQELGHGGLGARDWSQVAILCPRKNWLLEIQRELLAWNLPVQLHSSNEQQGERTPGAWLTALLWIAAHPEDVFEITGVLREILGVSDHDMAVFTEGKGDRLRLNQSDLETNGPVENALKTLREAFANTDTLPLHQAVRQMVERTQLRERMNSIPELALENVGRELDDFLALIAERSAAGVTLAELAQELRLSLAQVSPAEEEIRNAIQLLTSHKSKGLEWDAVILPGIFRTIESKAIPYPRLVQLEGGQEIICRDKGDFASQALAFTSTRDRQQLQRLLYVMCTRAKRTLLLVDDETLFSGQKRRSGWSAGELLGLTSAPNGNMWKALPEELSWLDPSATKESPSTPAPVVLPILSQQSLQQALTRASAFHRRITPHALAIHRPAEAEPERQMEQEEGQPISTAENPGILYGTWWHEFVETIPWQKPVAEWQKKFLEAQSRSPQPERSSREWELFRRSALAEWLAQPGRLIQIEMPFLWLDADQKCIEGIMDLAVYTGTEWRVIDWKTNHVGSERGNGLVEVYRGQIRAYVQALREMLSAEVTGSLYLTQTGEWIDVD